MCYKTLPSGYDTAIAITNTHQLWLKHKTYTERKEEKGGREEEGKKGGRDEGRALK